MKDWISATKNIIGHSLACFRNLRSDDVLLASFPRSGNTWVSFLLANLLMSQFKSDLKVNFFTIQSYIPEIGSWFCHLPEYPISLPRIIKTHGKFSKFYNKTFYLVREPESVMSSYFRYSLGLGLIDSKTNFSIFIRSPNFGIPAWKKHVESFLIPAQKGRRVQIFRYEDFQRNTAEELNRMIIIYGLKINVEVIDQSINASSKEVMRELECITRNSVNIKSEYNFRFVNSGESPEISWEDKQFIYNETKDLRGLLGYDK